MVHKASISRRRFLKATAAAVSAPLFLPSTGLISVADAVIVLLRPEIAAFN